MQHKDLALGRWQELSLVEQMANIGSEVGRTINWKNKDNDKFRDQAFECALELFFLTVKDKKNKTGLKEILRVRAIFKDYIFGTNEYNFSDDDWQKYFYEFSYASRKNT